MKRLLPLVLVLATVPAWAQIRAINEKHILRNAPPSIEEETPTVSPPVNLRPTQLLRCPDGRGGTILQDRPCNEAATASATAPAANVTDLSQLPPRPQAEAPAAYVDDSASNRWTKGALFGAGKLALLLAAVYGLYRLGLYVRDRLQDRMPRTPMHTGGARRVR